MKKPRRGDFRIAHLKPMAIPIATNLRWNGISKHVSRLAHLPSVASVASAVKKPSEHEHEHEHEHKHEHEHEVEHEQRRDKWMTFFVNDYPFFACVTQHYICVI